MKASKSNERGGNTGQKSVTNKYAKVFSVVDDFGSTAPVAQIPSSATNKIKKSFNFDTNGGGVQQLEMSSIDNKSNDASGASRTKKQNLMNQIML